MPLLAHRENVCRDASRMINYEDYKRKRPPGAPLEYFPVKRMQPEHGHGHVYGGVPSVAYRDYMEFIRSGRKILPASVSTQYPHHDRARREGQFRDKVGQLKLYDNQFLMEHNKYLVKSCHSDCLLKSAHLKLGHPNAETLFRLLDAWFTYFPDRRYISGYEHRTLEADCRQTVACCPDCQRDGAQNVADRALHVSITKQWSDYRQFDLIVVRTDIPEPRPTAAPSRIAPSTYNPFNVGFGLPIKAGHVESSQLYTHMDTVPSPKPGPTKTVSFASSVELPGLEYEETPATSSEPGETLEKKNENEISPKQKKPRTAIALEEYWKIVDLMQRCKAGRLEETEPEILEPYLKFFGPLADDPTGRSLLLKTVPSLPYLVATEEVDTVIRTVHEKLGHFKLREQPHQKRHPSEAVLKKAFYWKSQTADLVKWRASNECHLCTMPNWNRRYEPLLNEGSELDVRVCYEENRNGNPSRHFEVDWGTVDEAGVMAFNEDLQKHYEAAQKRRNSLASQSQSAQDSQDVHMEELDPPAHSVKRSSQTVDNDEDTDLFAKYVQPLRQKNPKFEKIPEVFVCVGGEVSVYNQYNATTRPVPVADVVSNVSREADAVNGLLMLSGGMKIQDKLVSTSASSAEGERVLTGGGGKEREMREENTVEEERRNSADMERAQTAEVGRHGAKRDTVDRKRVQPQTAGEGRNSAYMERAQTAGEGRDTAHMERARGGRDSALMERSQTAGEGRDTAHMERARGGRDSALMERAQTAEEGRHGAKRDTVDRKRVQPQTAGEGRNSAYMERAQTAGEGRDTAHMERARGGRDSALMERSQTAGEGRDTAHMERARGGRDSALMERAQTAEEGRDGGEMMEIEEETEKRHEGNPNLNDTMLTEDGDEDDLSFLERSLPSHMEKGEKVDLERDREVVDTQRRRDDREGEEEDVREKQILYDMVETAMGPVLIPWGFEITRIDNNGNIRMKKVFEPEEKQGSEHEFVTITGADLEANGVRGRLMPL